MANRSQFSLVSDTLEWLAAHRSEQPDLVRTADAMGVSPYHLQRTFRNWAGVTPKQFLKALTRDAAVARLERGETVLDAALATGLSGPGRLHDLIVSTEALTPGEARQQARGVHMTFGFGNSPFGRALLCWNDRGLNFLGFCNEVQPENAVAQLQGRWRQAQFQRDDARARTWLERVFSNARAEPLPVWLRGSPFQLKVWEALLRIPEDANVSYGQIARAIGQPGASRAVGSAVGNNPVAWIIPCHRVIRQLGAIGGYRWGVKTKRAMLGYEATAAVVNRPY
jgi:AraC family transcriptional regulator of adaptative response/methylated-DNA-[protein]-cysteine methyltransferase